MALFIGRECPGCHKIFKENEQVVVCPVCGTPHHRECYDEYGSCVHHERHADGFQWNGGEASGEKSRGEPENSGEHSTLCPRCGVRLGPGVLHCPQCGQFMGDPSVQPENKNPNEDPPFGYGAFPFGGNTGYSRYNGYNIYGGVPPDEAIKNISVKEIGAFVRVNTHYYIPKFYRADKHKKKISFNFAAFFFPEFWFMYRKLYFAGIIYILLDLLTKLIFSPYTLAFYNALSDYTKLANTNGTTDAQILQAFQTVKAPEALYPFLFLQLTLLIVRIFFGVLANRMYMNRTFSSLHKIGREQNDPEMRKYQIMRKGGVNFLFGMLGMFLSYNLIYAFQGVLGLFS